MKISQKKTLIVKNNNFIRLITLNIRNISFIKQSADLEVYQQYSTHLACEKPWVPSLAPFFKKAINSGKSKLVHVIQ